MKTKLARIIIAAILLVAAAIIDKYAALTLWQTLLVYLVPYFTVGLDVIAEAVEALIRGKAFNEDLLMSIATAGALSIGFLPDSEPQFAEAVFVMLFFQIGELFEHYAEGKSRRAISSLMEIRPDTATVLRDGSEQTVSPDTVAIGEIIIVKPGERIPLDGNIIDGTSSLDTVALTGESLPRDVCTGDTVASGCVNISGLLKIKVTKNFAESTASRIIDLVENAGENKSKSETFIARFAKIYTPIVVAAALLLAFVPPLLQQGEFSTLFPIWLGRALTFLVVSCPCAFVISIPLAFFGGIGGASKQGILIKGSNYIETLSRIGTVVFDKTGTLTKGRFEVCAIHPDKCDEHHLLHLAAHVERYSTHPIAISLRNAYPNEQDSCRVENIREIAGQGIKALVNGIEVCVGNSKLMDTLGVDWHPCHKVGTIVHVTIDGTYAGHIVVSDTIKEDSKEAIRRLKAIGVDKTVMLTGDRAEVGKYVASETGIDEYHAEMTPAGKVAVVEGLINTGNRGRTLAFVGDGINDAPVLARADVGIAMGALGSDAAIEAADVVLMDDKPSKIATAITTARHTMHIAAENAWFAISVKLLVLVLAGFGLATMWMAVFADVGVTVIAVLNAMRALRPPRRQ